MRPAGRYLKAGPANEETQRTTATQLQRCQVQAFSSQPVPVYDLLETC